MAEELDAGTIAFAHRMFALARSGATAELSAHVAAGLPANLTNDKGDTLLMLAAYRSEKYRKSVKFLFPSSIAAYGMPDLETKRAKGAIGEEECNTPHTMYGCNKLYCEKLGTYYSKYYGQKHLDDVPPHMLDFRAIRFPGLISAFTLPSGGTSDYGPEMLHAAAQGHRQQLVAEADADEGHAGGMHVAHEGRQLGDPVDVVVHRVPRPGAQPCVEPVGVGRALAADDVDRYQLDRGVGRVGREHGAEHVDVVAADGAVPVGHVIADQHPDPRGAHGAGLRWNDFGRVTARNPSADSVTPRPESFTPVHARAGSR